MTPFKVSSVFNTRINHKLSKYIFLEIFILIALFCSHFTQGNVDFKFIHAQKTIPVPYQLYISFCDNDLECFINESRQIFSDNICSNIMCSSIVRNRTINCQEKVSTSINDNLILDLRCNILEKRHIQLVKRQSNFFDSNILKSFQVQRRLLSKSKTKSRRPRVTKTTKVLPKNDSIVIDSIVTVAEGEAESDGFAQTTKEPFNYTKFREVVEYLNKGRSKDPFWAMFSILSLMGILVWAMWCCGMKRIQTHKFINVTIDEHFHYVSVRDVLKSKKKYLSKKILQFKRRHMHRKHKYRRLKEQKVNIENVDQDVVSDNSEDERLIYANDF